jgi:hypothetical protein
MMPPDPFALEAGAADFYRVFMSYVNTGFTRAEALDICKSILLTQMAIDAGMKQVAGE